VLDRACLTTFSPYPGAPHVSLQLSLIFLRSGSEKWDLILMKAVLFQMN
jgi:hypothetical protein